MNNQQKRDQAVDRALAAKARLVRLRQSPDFVKRYAANDIDAVDAVRILTRLQAAGTDIAAEDHARHECARLGVVYDETAVDPSVAQAHQQTVDAMVNDAEFREKFARGDPAAVRQWRHAMVDGAAGVLGVSQAENRGAAATIAEQPAAGSVGAVTAGATE